MNCNISVVIPLYNKEQEIVSTLNSVLEQSLLPHEIIVVDDGSTDGGAALVESFDSPLIRLIRQPNAGVSAARNRGAAEAQCDYIALLDADDRWEAGFIEKINQLIAKYPNCGLYSTGFWSVRHNRKHLTKSPEKEGILEDFFLEATRSYICFPSSTTISRKAWNDIGGFPVGMKMGEDLYFWIKLADKYQVCFSPEPLANYVVTASNRSVKSYTRERTEHSFQELYRPEDGNSCRNEYIAKCALGKALVLSSHGDTEFGREAEHFFAYTRMFRRAWRKLCVMNRLPRKIRPAAHNCYNKMAWLLAKKGF